MPLVCTAVLFLETAWEKRFMIQGVESTLKLIAGFLSAMKKMGCIDSAISELQFVEFWTYFFKIFDENFFLELFCLMCFCVSRV